MIPIISIDGPTAAGKGTASKALAQHFGFAFLDTGLLYRVVARVLLDHGLDPQDEAAAAHIAATLTIDLCQHTPLLRTEEVSQAASIVASHPQVRLALLEAQRRFPEQLPPHSLGLVLDGRDIGTVVFPDADVKFFITAAPEERARRRYLELQQRGESCTLDDVLCDLQMRDARDTGRAVSPLRAADDAVIIDTTMLTPDEVVQSMVRWVSSRLHQRSTALSV